MELENICFCSRLQRGILDNMRKILVLVLSIYSDMIFGQGFFNMEGLSDGQQISMQRMEWRYVSEDDDEWDFTGLDVLDEGGLTYYHLSDSTLLEVRPDAMMEYQIVGDSLLLSRYETPLTRLVYDTPVCLLTGSMTIGDSILSDFCASGTYCNKFAVSVMGQSKTKPERYGTLILQEDDTLRNVLCLQHIKTAHVSMQIKSDSLAEVRSYTERTDEYEWYVSGSAHPIYRSTVTECLENGQPTFRKQVAYRITDEILPEKSNRDEEDIVLDDGLEDDGLPPCLSDFSIRLEGNRVYLDFETTTATTLRSILCDTQGVSYRNASHSCSQGERGTIGFDINGLRRGTYVIYLNANGFVVGRNINI